MAQWAACRAREPSPGPLRNGHLLNTQRAFQQELGSPVGPPEGPMHELGARVDAEGQPVREADPREVAPRGYGRAWPRRTPTPSCFPSVWVMLRGGPAEVRGGSQSSAETPSWAAARLLSTRQCSRGTSPTVLPPSPSGPDIQAAGSKTFQTQRWVHEADVASSAACDRRRRAAAGRA